MLDALEQYIHIQSESQREQLQILLNQWVTRLITLLGSVHPPHELSHYINLDYPFLSLFFLSNQLKPDVFTDWVDHQKTKQDRLRDHLQTTLHHQSQALSQVKDELDQERRMQSNRRHHQEEIQRDYQHCIHRLAQVEHQLARETFKLTHCTETKSLLEKLFFIALKGYQKSGTPELREHNYMTHLQHRIDQQEAMLKLGDKGLVTSRSEDGRVVINEDPVQDMECGHLLPVPLPLLPVDGGPSPALDVIPPSTSSLLSPSRISTTTCDLDESFDSLSNDTRLDPTLLAHLQEAFQTETMKVTALKTDLTACQSESHFLQQEINAHLATLATMESKIDQFTKDKDVLTQQLTCCTTSLDHWKQRSQAQTDHIRTITGQLKAETQAKKELETSLTSDCEVRIQQLIATYQHTITLLETKNKDLGTKIEDDDQEFNTQLRLNDERMKVHRMEMSVLQEKTHKAQTDMEEMQHHYVQLSDEILESRSLANYLQGIDPNLTLDRVIDYITSLNAELENQKTDQIVLSTKLAKAEYSKTMASQQIKSMEDLYTVERKTFEETIHTLTTHRDDLQTKYNELSRNYTDFFTSHQGLPLDVDDEEQGSSTGSPTRTELQAQLNDLTTTLAFKNSLIAELKTAKRAQEQRQHIKKTFKEKDVSKQQLVKLQLETTKCKLTKDKLEKEFSSLSKQHEAVILQSKHYQQQVDELTTSLTQLKDTTSPSSSVIEEGRPHESILTYHHYFFQYLETVLMRMKQVTTMESFHPLLKELGHYYEAFSNHTLTDEMEPFMTIIATYPSESQPLIEQPPAVSPTTLELSELISCRYQLHKALKETNQSHLPIINTLKSLVSDPDHVLEEVLQWKHLFPTPVAFQNYKLFYTQWIIYDDQRSYVDTILTILKEFYDGSLYTISNTLTDTLNLIKEFGGLPLLTSLHQLLLKTPKRHHVIKYFNDELDVTNSNKLVKYYHALEILFHVYQASLHKPLVSVEEMERNYLISLLTHPDYEHFEYDYTIVDEKASKQRTAHKKETPSFQIRRRKKATKVPMDTQS